MARKCDICGKSTVTGNAVSHSHRKTRRRWEPNLKKMRVKDGNSTAYKMVCTRCIRSGKVEKVF